MTRSFLVAAILVAIQISAPARAAEDAPVVVKLLTMDIELAASGLAVKTQHVEMQAKNDAAAKQIGQSNLYFSEALEDLEIVEAYTLKADGQKLAVDPAAIFAQHPQGAPDVPSFNDSRQKVIVFPNVAGGDSIIYTARWRAKAAVIPGHFFYSSYLSRTVAYNDVRYSIVAPKSLPLRIENHEIKFEKADVGDTTRYRWSYAAPIPKQEEQHPVSPFDYLPRFFVSTFKDHEQFAHTYAEITAEKEIVTPEIQKLVDEITATSTDRRGQAQKIYEWVSKNIRYVAIDIGNAGIVPHDAATILKNGYGDCKDHNVLFATLLKAKNIGSETVLINYGTTYSLPDVSAITPLNHAITWLPEFNLYADTTSGVAPFGVLPFEQYGKPVIHAVTQGKVLRTTPVLAASVADATTKTTIRIDREGKVTGDTVLTASGPFSINLRSIAENIQGTGPERAAIGVLERQGLKGTGGFEFSPPTALAPEYTLKANFAYGPKSEWLDGQQFHMPRGIAPSDFPGDSLMGPLFDETLKDSEPTACFSGHMLEEITFEAAPGMRLRTPPPGLEVKSPHLTFSASWTATATSISVRREFTTKVDQALCTGAVRREADRALKQIRDHYLFTIALLASPQVAVNAAQAKLTDAATAYRQENYPEAIRIYTQALAEPNITLAQRKFAYLNRAYAYISARDYMRSVSDLSQAIRLGEATYMAYLNRGFAYAQLYRSDRAIADYGEAIRLRADAEEPYRRRGLYYLDYGLWEKAVADCTQAIRLAPGTTPCHRARGYAYYIMAEFDKALADLNQAVKVNATDGEAYYNRGMVQLALEKYPQAIADFTDAINLSTASYGTLFARSVAKFKSGDETGAEIDRAAAAKIKPNVAFEMAGFGITTDRFVKGVDDIAACKAAENLRESIQGLVFCTRALTVPNLSPKDMAIAYAILGGAYVGGGHFDEAIVALDKAIALDASNINAISSRGLAHLRKDDYDKGLADMDVAIRLAPARPDFFVMRGNIYGDKGDYDHADADFTQAIKLDPDFLPIYLVRGRMNEAAGRLDKSVQDFDTLIRMSPKPVASWYGGRCFVLGISERLAAAQADCEKALVADPADVMALNAQAYLYLKLGQDEQAVRAFDDTIKKNAQMVEAYYGRGLAKLRMGDATGNDDLADATMLDPDFVNRMRLRGYKPN